MRHISTHVDDDLAERFSALARAHGGKSALLRCLITHAVNGQLKAGRRSCPIPRRAPHLSVRLSANGVAKGLRGLVPPPLFSLVQ